MQRHSNHVAHQAALKAGTHQPSTLDRHHCWSQTAADVKAVRTKGMRMPVAWRQSLQHSSNGKKEFVSQENVT
jgi:hypothetical protein